MAKKQSVSRRYSIWKKLTKLRGVFPAVVTNVPVAYSIKNYKSDYNWVSIKHPDGKVVRIGLRK